MWEREDGREKAGNVPLIEVWQYFWVNNRCARTCVLSPMLAFLSVYQVPVLFLYYESLSDTWASSASVQLLDWPQMSIWKCCHTVCALGGQFLQFLCLQWLSCPLAGNRRKDGEQQTRQQEKNNQRNWLTEHPRITFTDPEKICMTNSTGNGTEGWVTCSTKWCTNQQLAWVSFEQVHFHQSGYKPKFQLYEMKTSQH